MIVTVQGQQFNTDALKGFTEEQFLEAFRGVVKCDINEAWRHVKKHVEPPQQVKKKTTNTRKKKKAAE